MTQNVPAPPSTTLPASPELTSQLAVLQAEIDSFALEMRRTNIRSYPLKITTHERWCGKIQHIGKQLQLIRDHLPRS